MSDDLEQEEVAPIKVHMEAPMAMMTRPQDWELTARAILWPEMSREKAS